MGACRRLVGLAAFLVGLNAACGARTGVLVDGQGAQDGGSAPSECVRLDAEAERSTLVVIVMLDTSGSMAFKTDTGATKATVVRNALADFFADPASAGMGVGEAFFPILRQGVPDHCSRNSDCGAPDSCSIDAYGVCWPSGSGSCFSDADCAGNGHPMDLCVTLGACGGDIHDLCLRDQPANMCASGVKCLGLGYCANQTSCDESDYAKLVVDVGTLPGARSKLLLGLDTQTSKGATPTLPALRGALATAGAWQDAHSGQKAIVLLATDGLPTTCDPAIPRSLKDTTLGVPAVTATAQAGIADGVQTFVVGVFSPEEQPLAEDALGTIAAAGGTEKAFIVTTGSTVAGDLAETLDHIRRRAGACEYAIFQPSTGRIDPQTMTVTVRGAQVSRVASADSCGASGGFYFDRDPQPGVLPHRVILCPATCGMTPPGTIRLESQCDGTG